MILGATSWVVLALLYLLFAGQASRNELVACVPAALATMGFAAALHRQAEHRFRLRAPWGRIVLAVATALPRDAVAVGRVLLGALGHRPRGSIGARMEQPFAPGSDNAADRGRRALVMLDASVAPNRFVLAPSRNGALVMHRLAPAPPRPDRRWPV